ncbi:hypothetical protein P4O66_000769 [Electrophorus voltai]|uniref:Myosin motor domain-containing protein n=1 Tax=Electrophorus voltai TaxID=2609070 RepID=A0AAD8ZDV9_9TELE|nr:hypothetical protein P4O66_000769 [Electrophorus voltai]
MATRVVYILPLSLPPVLRLSVLKAGVNALLQDVNGNTALDYAADGAEGRCILTKHLEENGVDLSSMHQLKTQRASVMLSDVRQLVSSGASVNQRNEDGVTLLHMACASGYRDVVSLLLASGADVLAADSGYWTPVHLAAKYGQVSAGQSLFLPVSPIQLSAGQSLFLPVSPIQVSAGQSLFLPVSPIQVSAGQSLFLPVSPIQLSAGQSLFLPVSPIQTHIVNQLLKHKADPTLLNCNQDKPSDVAASAQIAARLLEAEGTWCMRQQEMTMPSPDTHEPREDAGQDVGTLLRKLGESGSGKSEACKHILKHLAARSCHKDLILGAQMMHANAVLEAFGHAKTPMNCNASRYIKLLSLQFCGRRRTLLRARVYTYMLEKTRVISRDQQNLNFNVFYLMANGLSAEEKSRLYLNNILAHRYLSSVEPSEVLSACPRGKEKLAALKQALCALEFRKPEVENLFVVLSALLHLGDLRFTTLTDTDAALVSDLQLLEKVADMLQVDPGDLACALTSDVQYFKGDVITRRHTVEMSNYQRDLLAKALYGRLFSFLVNTINGCLQGPEENPGDPDLEISILDIFGFEKFQKSSFEQLCINMVSERIHQYTTDVLFQQEQQECLQEAVAMETRCAPADQPAVLDYFYQKPHSLLCVLDEESQSLRPSELSLYVRLQGQLDSTPADPVTLTTKDGNGNPPPEDHGPVFSITHYAGRMSYDLTGSLDKNRDTLPQNILFVLKSSDNILIHQLFRVRLTQTGTLGPEIQHRRLSAHTPRGPGLLRPGVACHAHNDQKHLEFSKFFKKKGASSFLQRLERSGPVTLATQLRNSLSEISRKLRTCTPHFVQCVRPNAGGRPDVLDSALVSAQLQYVGVLEMVHAIRYGYPVRLPFDDFLSRSHGPPHTLHSQTDTWHSTRGRQGRVVERGCAQLGSVSMDQGRALGWVGSVNADRTDVR